MIKNSSDPNVGNLRAEVESHQNYPRKLNISELTQQDGRGKKTATLCDKRDNNFV